MNRKFWIWAIISALIAGKYADLLLNIVSKINLSLQEELMLYGAPALFILLGMIIMGQYE
jgi:hypothetical protein